MKFDNLYRLVVNAEVFNEATASEDLKELNQDKELGGKITPSDVTPMEPDIEDVEGKDPLSMNTEEKIQYLMKYSRLLNKNPNWTENDKRAKAEYLVKNDLFDAFIEPIESRFEAELEDDELGGVESPETDVEEIGDIRQSLRADRELRMREQEDEEESLFGQEI